MTGGGDARSMPAGSGWWRACALDDLPDGGTLRVELAGLPICLVRARNRVYALYDECTHESVPLSEGDVDDGVIECWAHGSRFDLVTGAALNPPAVKPVPVYAVRVTDDGQVHVAVADGPA